jgi:hypothetical protein
MTCRRWAKTTKTQCSALTRAETSVTDYSKTAFEDAARTFNQLVGAKSLESVVEIQSQYAKAYDTWVA